MARIDYKVVFISSEDDEFPASNLQSGVHGNQTGWLSERFPTNPQEIGIWFLSGVSHVQRLQIIAHPTMIPRRISIMAGHPKPGVANEGGFGGYENAVFEDIGFVVFDSNRRTDYEASEMKTINLNFTSHFLKILLDNPHHNEHNMYHQVGIKGINIIGEKWRPEVIDSYHKASPFAPSPHNPSAEKDQPLGVRNFSNIDLAFNKVGMSLTGKTKDEVIVEEVQEYIQKTKKIAEKTENYQEAQRLAPLLRRLAEIRHSLLHLTSRKAEALASEDFEVAMNTKDEIDFLMREVEGIRRLAERPITKSPTPEPSPIPQSSPSPAPQSPAPPEQPPSPAPATPPPRSPTPPPPEEPPLSVTVPSAVDTPDIPSPARSLHPDERKLNPDGAYDIDRPESDLIDATNSHLLELMEESDVVSLYSKKWDEREAGITSLTARLNDGRVKLDKRAPVRGCFEILNRGLKDRNVHVYNSSLTLLHTICDKLKEEKSTSRKGTELRAHIENTIPLLMPKFADTTSRVREAAMNAIQALAEVEAIGPNGVWKFMVKPIASSHHRELTCQMIVLRELVEKFVVVDDSRCLEQLMACCVPCLDNANVQVRSESVNLATEVYLAVGLKPISRFLEDIRPATLNVLEARFNEANAEAETPPLSQVVGDGAARSPSPIPGPGGNAVSIPQ